MPDKHDKSEHERIISLERQMESVASTVASISESFNEPEEDPISELTWKVNALGLVLRHAEFQQQGIITQFKLRNIDRRNIAKAISAYADAMLRPPPTGFNPDKDQCQMFRQGKGRWAVPYCDGKCDGGGSCRKVEIRARTSTWSDVYDVTVRCDC